MNAESIALKLASLVFAGGIFIILYKRIKVLKKYGLASLVYVLLISVLLSIPTLFLLFELSISDLLLLVLAQIFILSLGILHVFLTPTALPWYKDQPFRMQILFIICILILGYFFCNLSLSYLVNPKLQLVWYLSILWFLVPVLLNETINLLLKVPPKVFEQWYYPVNENIDDPSDEELENPIVISFIFHKNENSQELTTFRAKAPVGMKLGRLFYFFINDYNSRHPESQISFLSADRVPNGWVFMKVKNKFFRLLDAIDPKSSIYGNNIRENDVLICKRIINN